MILNPEIITKYNNSRSRTYKGIICHAPFVNLNFEQNGNVRSCCYNTSHVLGKWPEKSVIDIWEGEKSKELRNYILQQNLGGGCEECGKMIQAGNYHGVRAKYYDEYSSGRLTANFEIIKHKLAGVVNFPRVMEFEISNECNLECVMCNGYFSSSIRKNREKRSPIPSPYNNKFVDELESFLPHLTDAKFLGGEPFMIELYLLIWERILKINPRIRIHITTNGTFLNNRIKDLLEGLNAGIVLSIDSVNQTTYSKIRVNGIFGKVMENVEYFMDYTKRKHTFISIAACPIIYNWKELPQLFEFCYSKNIALYFNAVFTPVELSLREQTLEMQEEILAYLESYPLPQIEGSNILPRNLSIRAFNDFILQLKGWRDERKQQLQQKDLKIAQLKYDIEIQEASVVCEEWSLEKILNTLIEITAIEGKGLFVRESELKTSLSGQLYSTPNGQFKKSLDCYLLLQQRMNNTPVSPTVDNAISAFAIFIENQTKKREIMIRLAALSPLFFAKWLTETEESKMKEMAGQFFSGE